MEFRVGSIVWNPNRQLMRQIHTLESRVSEEAKIKFGLDMVMTYEDMKGNVKKCNVIIRHNKKKRTYLYLKSYKTNPSINDLIEQFKDFWVIVGAGGTAGSPELFVVIRIKDIPLQYFILQTYARNKNRGAVVLGDISEWKSVKYKSLFGDTVESELEKIRRS